MNNKENNGSTRKNGDSSEYLELKDLPDSSVVEHSFGQTGETNPGTVSGIYTSTPTREFRRSSREPKPNLRYLLLPHYLLLTDNGELESYNEAKQVSESSK